MKQGYTKLVLVCGGCEERELYIKLETDLDSRFKAWDEEEQGFVWVNGWACDIDEL